MNKTSLLDYLEKNLPKRSIELKKIFSKQKLDYEKIWPQLDTISCWMDGSSSIFINNLKNKFPNINFQKKGLISTESLVTIPLSKYNDNILSPLSAFYEFKKENDFFLAHQLLKNCIYEVLITTYSGLYRYQLFDLVKVVDIIDNIPLLKFIGRSNITSDMCGEKLNEDFVLDIFNQVLPHCPKILCACKGQPPYYKLIIETNENVKKLNILIDEKLKQNPHYKLARELGQLDNLVVTTTKSLVNFINKKYPNYYTDGNHKTPILLTLNPQPQNLFQLRSLKDSFLLIQLL